MPHKPGNSYQSPHKLRAGFSENRHLGKLCGGLGEEAHIPLLCVCEATGAARQKGSRYPRCAFLLRALGLRVSLAQLQCRQEGLQ